MAKTYKKYLKNEKQIGKSKMIGFDSVFEGLEKTLRINPVIAGNAGPKINHMSREGSYTSWFNTSPSRVKKVIDWYNTKEGKEFLKAMLAFEGDYEKARINTK